MYSSKVVVAVEQQIDRILKNIRWIPYTKFITSLRVYETDRAVIFLWDLFEYRLPEANFSDEN